MEEEDKFLRACKEGSLEVVKQFNDQNRKTKDKGFRWACRSGHLNIVKYLISIGANVHSYNRRGMQWAFEYSHLELVKYFIENHNADQYLYGNRYDFYRSCLSWACMTTRPRATLKNFNTYYPKYYECIKYIIDCVDITDSKKIADYLDILSSRFVPSSMHTRQNDYKNLLGIFKTKRNTYIKTIRYASKILITYKNLPKELITTYVLPFLMCK